MVGWLPHSDANIPQTDRALAATDVAETPQIISPESSRCASVYTQSPNAHVNLAHSLAALLQSSNRLINKPRLLLYYYFSTDFIHFPGQCRQTPY